MGNLGCGIDLSKRRKPVPSTVHQGARSSPLISITLNPVLGIQPRQDLSQEAFCISRCGKLGKPDGFASSSIMHIDQMLLEVRDIGGGVIPMRCDKVDLAVSAPSEEGLEIRNTHCSTSCGIFLTVGDSWGADLDVGVFASDWLDPLFVGSDCLARILNANTTTTTRC